MQRFCCSCDKSAWLAHARSDAIISRVECFSAQVWLHMASQVTAQTTGTHARERRTSVVRCSSWQRQQQPSVLVLSTISSACTASPQAVVTLLLLPAAVTVWVAPGGQVAAWHAAIAAAAAQLGAAEGLRSDPMLPHVCRWGRQQHCACCCVTGGLSAVTETCFQLSPLSTNEGT